MSKKLSLAETHPELAKQWHPTKNGDLSPEKVTRGSDKKVWWKCRNGSDHEWEASVSSRVRGRGCKVCSGWKVVESNCLATLKPELASEWNFEKNSSLTPSDVTPQKNLKVWWTCKVDSSHVWEAKICNRSNGRGCPYCSGHKLGRKKSFGALFPDLVKELHPTKNGDIDPFLIFPSTSKKVWWRCSKGTDHIWEASLNNRTSKGRGCPICSGQKVVPSNSLASTHPEIAKEWHPTKNGDNTPLNVSQGSIKKYWWQCSIDPEHIWEGPIAVRTSKYKKGGCPVCYGRKVVKTTSFGYRYPEIAEEWHPTKNGSLTVFEVTPFSGKNVYWRCSKGKDHVWKSKVSDRVNGNGCPVCANQVVVQSNSMRATHPKLTEEFDNSRNNGLTPDNIGAFYSKRVWWVCSRDPMHTWQAIPWERSNGNTGCPYCTLTPQSKQELIITFELLKFFKNINPKGHKTRLNGKLRSIDIFIPDLNLAIEFDGSYWHKDKRAIDKIKSEMLMDEGYQVIRIREHPLKKIFENDIISKLPYNGKEITDNILKRILELYSVKDSMRSKIHNYFSKEGLHNEKALDKYIYQILEEKATKRNVNNNTRSNNR